MKTTKKTQKKKIMNPFEIDKYLNKKLFSYSLHSEADKLLMRAAFLLGQLEAHKNVIRRIKNERIFKN